MSFLFLSNLRLYKVIRMATKIPLDRCRTFPHMQSDTPHSLFRRIHRMSRATPAHIRGTLIACHHILLHFTQFSAIFCSSTVLKNRRKLTTHTLTIMLHWFEQETFKYMFNYTIQINGTLKCLVSANPAQTLYLLFNKALFNLKKLQEHSQKT